MRSLNLCTKLSFEPRIRISSLTVTTKKGNACSPWNPCFVSLEQNPLKLLRMNRNFATFLPWLFQGSSSSYEEYAV